ncbi:MAG: hypothetical protein AAF291_12725 [Pseudomonadota bacterium]
MNDKKNTAFFTSAMIGVLATLTTACATSAPANQSTSSASTLASAPNLPPIKSREEQSRAGRIAVKLARAEAAFEAGDTELLSKLVASLNANGVKPATDTQPDRLAVWQSAAGSSAPPFRGRLLGPAYVRGELAPGETWRSAQTFKSGEASTLSVSHKGAGPVHMTVSDAKARAVCNPGPATTPPCRFTPMFTQRYNIELTNEGAQRAVYYLVFD